MRLNTQRSLRSKIINMTAEPTIAMGPRCPMGIAEIQACIPHRFPFLLVDRVEAFELSSWIVATKILSNADTQGHFPGRSVLPGVLVIEAAAQTAAILGHLSSPSGLSSCSLAEIQNSRFRHVAIPGDVIRLDVRLSRQRAPFFWFRACAHVGDRIIADINFSAYMK